MIISSDFQRQLPDLQSDGELIIQNIQAKPSHTFITASLGMDNFEELSKLNFYN